VTTPSAKQLPILALALLAGACSSARQSPSPKIDSTPARELSAATRSLTSTGCDAASTDTPDDLSSVQVIHPNRRVPRFSVTSVDCQPLRSNELVGRQPLILVFFSSWCRVCDMKMPLVREAARRVGGAATFVGVALDDDDTWDSVAAFVDRNHLAFPVVRGMHFPAFTLGYNPFGGVPVVVVVGVDGRLVDLQVGYSPSDLGRLLVAMEIAASPDPSQLSPPGRQETPVTLPDSGS
jgi:thiol-disulfide isomerase/thioredoxin